MDIEGANGVSHLQNLQSSFDNLKSEAIDKQTRSEGVKACMDLKVLSESAEFTIRIGDGVPVAQVRCRASDRQAVCASTCLLVSDPAYNRLI